MHSPSRVCELGTCLPQSLQKRRMPLKVSPPHLEGRSGEAGVGRHNFQIRNHGATELPKTLWIDLENRVGPARGSPHNAMSEQVAIHEHLHLRGMSERGHAADGIAGRGPDDLAHVAADRARGIDSGARARRELLHGYAYTRIRKP